MRKGTFTIRETNLIRENYEKLDYLELSNLLDRSKTSIKNWMYRANLEPTKKPKTLPVKSPGKRTRRYRPTGSLRVLNGYWFIKDESGLMVRHNRYLWEQSNGKIPEGHIVIFKNKDPMDCRIENLELILKSKHNTRR